MRGGTTMLKYKRYFNLYGVNLVFMKRKKLLAILVLMSIMQGTAYADINEKPEAGKQYDEFLYYDGNGSKNISIQGSVEGTTQNYYFNQGATFDGSEGTTHSVIVSHNWGNYNDNTWDIFNIGEGKNFTLLQYCGYGNLTVEEGANLKIAGGSIILESGSNSSDFDNTSSAIHMEDAGKIFIDSESLYIGNKRLDEGKHNVGAISVAGDGNVVDIDLKGSFVAENVDMGIASQDVAGKLTDVSIHTGDDIYINAFRSSGEAASGYHGSGIYSMAYQDENGKSKIDLISDKGNITIKAQGYGIYAYGNAETDLSAKQGNIIISSDEKHGIYAYSKWNNEQNKTSLTAKGISISGKSYGIYGNNAYIRTDSDTLSISAQNGWAVCLFGDSVSDFNTVNVAEFNGDLYTKGADINIDSGINNIKGQTRALENGTVDIIAGVNYLNSGSKSAVLAESEAKIDVTASAKDENGFGNYIISDTTAIEAKESSTVNINGDNHIEGVQYGVKADGSSVNFNVDNGKAAQSTGNINYIKSTAYREETEAGLADESKMSNAVNVANGSSFTAEGRANILEAGHIDEYGYGSETAIRVENGTVTIKTDGKNTFSEDEVPDGNYIAGAVYAANAGKAEITAASGDNLIMSSAHGRENSKTADNNSGIHLVSAVYAADNNAEINISAENGVNRIYSDFNMVEGHDDREITVWAENGGSVNIKGAVDIAASNHGKYTDGKKGNALGIAVSAGGRELAKDDNGTLIPVSDTSNVDIDYTSAVKDKDVQDGQLIASSIRGDIVAGYGGQINIYQNKGKDVSEKNSLNVTGNILAANGGINNVDLGKGGYWEGRADDYGDAGYGEDAKNHQKFYSPAFSNAIIEGGKVNVTMEEGTWNVTGQSWLTSLNGSNNTIDMVSYENNGTHAVTIGELNGSGNTFKMALNNENRSDSDMLYIKNGTADINVEITGTIEGLENVSQENGLRFATVGEGIKLANIDFATGKGIIRATNGGVFHSKLYVERHDYENENEQKYDDDFNGGDSGEMTPEKPGADNVDNFFGDDKDKADNLVIVKAEEDGTSDSGNTVVDLFKVNYSNAVYMDRFNKRMGEARFIDGDEGIWVRLRHDRTGKDNAFRSMNTMYEIGYDAKQVKEDGEHRVGFALDYMDGSSEFSKVAGQGEVSRKGLWMYDSWMGEKGHYREFVAKYGHLGNDFEFTSAAGEAKGDFSNNVFSISAEYGKKNDMGKGWYFEPQAQLQLAHVTGASYDVTMAGKKQSEIRNDAFNSLIARAGFRLGRDVNDHSTVYIKGDVLHEFMGDQDIYAKDGTTGGKWANLNYDNGGTWYDLGFGFAAKVNKASYAYMDFERSFGNDNEDTYQINVGMQWSF